LAPKKVSESRYHSAPLRVDPSAVTARQGDPPFIARPEGAPVYYGFPVLDDVEVDGFKFGIITDFESQPDSFGDAFIVAPDDSRAGLNWTVTEESFFVELLPPDEDRWGVWNVSFPYPMSSRKNVRRNLAAILPVLKEKWEAWKLAFPSDQHEASR
jgi:hypothetical protein